MQMVVICENFGWTYEKYLEQPLFFLELIKGRFKIDSQRQENQSKK